MAENGGCPDVIRDQHPEYWSDYSEVQEKKHEVLRKYLQAWFPILAKYNGRIVYFDSHAGRARHLSGEEGSPLIAIRTLLSHRSREAILRDCEVRFAFIEGDPGNHQHLECEVAAIRQLPEFDPKRIIVTTHCGDCFSVIDELLDYLEQENQSISPSLFFIDPYGFRLPGRTLSRLLTNPRTEIVLTVMWRYIQMAIAQCQTVPKMQTTLDDLFQSQDWRQQLADCEGDENGADTAASMIAAAYTAKFSTWLKLRGERGGIRYFLLHLANHPLAREKMKEIMWRVASNQDFIIRAAGTTGQGVLIAPESDVEPVKAGIVEFLKSSGPVSIDTIEKDWLLHTNWVNKHLTQALKRLHSDGTISTDPLMPALIRKRVNRVWLVNSTDDN